MNPQSLQIISKDAILGVVDKPAQLPVWSENASQTSIGSLLIQMFPELQELGTERRFGIVHRLDKDTSGLLLIACTKEFFEFFQKQFRDRKVEKRYICLAAGNIKQDSGTIHTLLTRAKTDRRKQKAVPLRADIPAGYREAITDYRVLKRLTDSKGNIYTLLEVSPRTGRKHQIRAQMAYLGAPLAADKLYGFKNQPAPEGLSRHFLHASYLKIQMPHGTTKEFHSDLPPDLTEALSKLTQLENN